MTFAVLFRQSAADFLHTLPEKSHVHHHGKTRPH